MHVPTEDPHDLGVACHNRLHLAPTIEPERIHASEPGAERRMVHKNHRRAPGRSVEGGFQPC